MKRNTALKVLNLILLVLLVNQAVTILFLPKLSHEAFEVLHKGGGAIFIVLAIVHFMLNLNWVKASYLPK